MNDFYAKDTGNKIRDDQFLWTYASVKNVLVEETYTGVLNNHRSETNGGKVKRLAAEERYRRHYRAKEWEKAQVLLKTQARPVNVNQAKHRYAGLLACAECDNPFVPMIRYWNGNRRVEYVCRSYHRGGKAIFSYHRIHEETLDAGVWELVSATHESCVEELKKLAQIQNR